MVLVNCLILMVSVLIFLIVLIVNHCSICLSCVVLCICSVLPSWRTKIYNFIYSPWLCHCWGGETRVMMFSHFDTVSYECDGQTIWDVQT